MYTAVLSDVLTVGNQLAVSVENFREFHMVIKHARAQFVAR